MLLKDLPAIQSGSAVAVVESSLQAKETATEDTATEDTATEETQALEQCQICGQSFEDVHACLQAIPSSLLTLSDPRIGSVVVDHYILEEFVCKSQTSMVYKARHQLLHTHVAVKTSHENAEHDAFSVLRTNRAALLAVRLDHPNIVRCIDYSHEAGQDAVLVMEWAHGTPLSQTIARETALTPLRAINLLEGLCDGLIYAHAQGVNHINLKPSGIMVTHTNGAEQARLMDFGLMKMLGPHTSEAALHSEHFRYSSPEERAGQPPDQRSMIYSLGLIFYDMLTGRVDALSTDLGSDQKMEIPALVKILPEIKEAEALDRIMSKCLATKPIQRFQNVEDLSFAIDQLKIELERIDRVEKILVKQDLAHQADHSRFWMVLLAMAAFMCIFFAFHNSIALR